MSLVVEALCVGLPKPFNGAELSAIDKRPVDGPVTIRSFGLEGDMVADTKHHGGADMAVHHYPHDHYAGWGKWLGGHELLARPGAFGENVHASGLVETAVHIGDRFRLGSALLEVSQPRKPCWKIDHRFGRKGMVARIVKTHNCGWYYRVIDEGEAQAGDALQRVETGHEGWSVARLFGKLYDPAQRADSAELDGIAGLGRLSAELRKSAFDKLHR
ncbi:MOSC domain-containing protein [Qipengyuania qiaonensis]|uniref:MOSC domain-containing protein n=1 Tax=Qipengyuania qiaonensis TaxID=2867240 RepID=A0ABS7J7E2_9SPHN|nr:MOSC domain-containing protein [Qipengyuania qiaonensis]MBX7480912.1 MOSC domain-containing protein [Qipengyuania qiaonensis]